MHLASMDGTGLLAVRVARDPAVAKLTPWHLRETQVHELVGIRIGKNTQWGSREKAPDTGARVS
jgi:hypothetical protein